MIGNYTFYWSYYILQVISFNIFKSSKKSKIIGLLTHLANNYAMSKSGQCLYNWLKHVVFQIAFILNEENANLCQMLGKVMLFFRESNFSKFPHVILMSKNWKFHFSAITSVRRTEIIWNCGQSTNIFTTTVRRVRCCKEYLANACQTTCERNRTKIVYLVLKNFSNCSAKFFLILQITALQYDFNFFQA